MQIRTCVSLLIALSIAASAIGGRASALPAGPKAPSPLPAAPTVRFMTYNASLNRFNAGQLITDLSTPNNV